MISRKQYHQASISNEVHNDVERMILKKWGLGRIFNHMRKLKKYSDFSDLGLLRSLLAEHRLHGKSLKKTAIQHQFRTRVSPEEYLHEEKQEILKDLYETSLQK